MLSSGGHWRIRLSRPDSRSDPIGGSEPISGTRDSRLGLLTRFFFLKPNWYLWVWPTLIIIQNIIYINRVPFTKTKLYFSNYKSERGPTCSEPFQVCWPSCMRMFADVFSCTYTEKKPVLSFMLSGKHFLYRNTCIYTIIIIV